MAMMLAALEAALSAADNTPGCRLVIREMCGRWNVARANLWDPARRVWLKDGAVARRGPKGWFVYPRYRAWEAELLALVPVAEGGTEPLIEMAIKHGSAEWEALSEDTTRRPST